MHCIHCWIAALFTFLLSFYEEALEQEAVKKEGHTVFSAEIYDVRHLDLSGNQNGSAAK